MNPIASCCQSPKNVGLVFWPGIDDLAPFGEGVRGVPVLDRVLALPRMRDVRITPDGVFLGNRRPQLRQGDANLRAVDDSAQPVRLLRLQIDQKRIEPFLIETLRRDPHLGVGMVAMQVGRLLFEKGKQDIGVGVTGVAAGNENRVDPRQLAEDVPPFVQRLPHRGRIGIIRVHRRIPNPHVQPVLIQQPRHFDHHLHLRKREMRAVGRIVGPRGKQFDRVGAEDGQVADVLFPHRHRPGVVGVGLRSISKLMPAERILRHRGHVQLRGNRDVPPCHPQRAQQAAHAKEHAPRIVARDRNDSRFARHDAHLVPLSPRQPARCGPFQAVLCQRRIHERRKADHDDGRRRFGPSVGDAPRELRPLFDLFDQHADGLNLRAFCRFVRDNDGLGQIDGVRRQKG